MNIGKIRDAINVLRGNTVVVNKYNNTLFSILLYNL